MSQRYEKKRPDFLEQRRKEILAEYKFYDLKPICVGTEPISIELALQLELLIDTRLLGDEAAA